MNKGQYFALNALTLLAACQEGQLISQNAAPKIRLFLHQRDY